MSDGPHRSLPMRRAWKGLAERADNPSYPLEQVAEAMCLALARDWLLEVPDSTLTALANAIRNATQGDMFNAGDRLESARAICESPLAASLGAEVADALANGVPVAEIMPRAVEGALSERQVWQNRAIEEHFLRRSDGARATNLRSRLEGAASLVSFRELARVIVGGQSLTRVFKRAKRDGLDEGIPL